MDLCAPSQKKAVATGRDLLRSAPVHRFSPGPRLFSLILTQLTANKGASL